VSAAAVSGGLVGRRRVSGFAREPLGPGALSVSPSAANLIRPDEVGEALARALGALGHAAPRVHLVLPDGLARLALMSLPADAEPREYVRFRLASSLPWPVSEAIVDVLPLGRGSLAAAAVRRAAVAEYEQALASAGRSVESVTLAPFLALTTISYGPRDAVHVLLGDAAATLVAVRGGRISALRSRRRDASAGEADRLVAEAARTARLGGDGAVPPRVVWTGSGAAGLQQEAGGGRALGGGASWPAASEAAWLAGALG
jgi:hypothetical protein